MKEVTDVRTRSVHTETNRPSLEGVSKGDHLEDKSMCGELLQWL
jgi:hypothetical protein